MREQYKISIKQYFTLIVLFELGSAILVGLGMNAGRDAWLAVLIGLVAGVFLFLLYIYMFKQFPELPLSKYLPLIVGKHFGKVLNMLYMLYFMYLAARVLRDFGSLLLSAVFVQTPIIVVNSLMILTIIYVLHLGFEVLARTGEIFFALTVLIGLSIFVLVLGADIMNWNYIKPIAGEGWMPVLKASFPVTPTFPFGEMIAFTMLFPYLRTKKKALSIGLTAMILSGLILSLTVAADIAILGGHVATHVFFPLLSAVAKINLGEFIQRLDALVVFTLITGGFFKIAVFLYVSVKIAQDVFSVKEERSLLMPLGIVILFGSVAVASNFVEHINEGLNIVPHFIHVPFQLIIPVFFTVIYLIRKKSIKKKLASGSSTLT
ncbi:endospore germination permease [Fictibacillus aquaticus]|uniref:Uncharacterized protein n=1 Tax=Fictibacillus aquaticus TaxID=2021314 RepID=A0A235FE42_9BACL|nr:endospore germination permease [Fictibacillus aquaticus]OYD59204.1 hypothetical protein CGZ90_04715 [Fictibacillus aquaticus]